MFVISILMPFSFLDSILPLILTAKVLMHLYVRASLGKTIHLSEIPRSIRKGCVMHIDFSLS